MQLDNDKLYREWGTRNNTRRERRGPRSACGHIEIEVFIEQWRSIHKLEPRSDCLQDVH